MPMSLETFHELLDQHGSRLANWPPEYRQDVDRLLLASKEARDALTEAARVESALRAAPPAFAPLGLLDRICQAVKDSESEKSDSDAPSQPDAAKATRSRKNEMLFRGLRGGRGCKKMHGHTVCTVRIDQHSILMWSLPVVAVIECLYRLFA